MGSHGRSDRDGVNLTGTNERFGIVVDLYGPVESFCSCPGLGTAISNSNEPKRRTTGETASENWTPITEPANSYLDH